MVSQPLDPGNSGRNDPALLRLPSTVRRRIYLFLGVARWDGCPLLFDLDGPVSPSDQVTFYGMLLSCRAVYTEASALLFSSNRFVIHYRNKRSLQPLRNLAPPSLAALTSLKVVLNQASCHHRREAEVSGACCTRVSGCFTRKPKGAGGHCLIRRPHKNLHDTPLQSSDPSARLMLEEWHATAVYLSSNTKLDALELSLVCDVDQKEVEAAEHIVAPLLLFPKLKDCHVRLCISPNSHLRQLARNASRQASSNPALEPASPTSGSSRLLITLPRELRIRILEYTDLVAPLKEVMWNRLGQGYHYFSSGCSAWEGVPCLPPYHHGCQYRDCHGQGIIKDGIVRSDQLRSIGCFCGVRHAAFSSTCKCWAPPTPLFLICRDLCEDARFVFFSANRFVVSDSLVSANPWLAYDVFLTPDPKWLLENRSNYSWMEWYGQAQPPRVYPAHRFAATKFLREVVPADYLGYLRFLELVFPPYNHECWPHDGHPALQDWIDTLDWVKDKINAPAITLRLVMAGSRMWHPACPDDRGGLTRVQGIAVLTGYDRILKPLAVLREHGLTRFYADFAWPWKWTKRVYERLRAADDPNAILSWLDGQETLLNDRAERLILGEDQHDRLRSNEAKPGPSPWKMHSGREY
ncbi:hypothetical protein B0J18DRAFT_464568 [Chaetomium sp. MPI-SDFR-AT-0129]|nr:hypothetical protein B0J18DRAFT_464568 [Chaetomium sp. MPI-SDFR-AT-0129]